MPCLQRPCLHHHVMLDRAQPPKHPARRDPHHAPGVGCWLLMQRRRYARKGAWTLKGARDKGRRGGAAEVCFLPSAYPTSGEVAVIRNIDGLGRCDGIGGGSSHRLGTVALYTVHELMGMRMENRDGNLPYSSAIVGSSEVEDIVIAYVAVAEKQWRRWRVPVLVELRACFNMRCASGVSGVLVEFSKQLQPLTPGMLDIHFRRLEATLSYPIVPKLQAQQQHDGRKKGAFGNVGIKDRAVHNVERYRQAMADTNDSQRTP
ncbi:hypothetical protein K438DRAFT_1788448 [Mycena galopus ATCC 62051]|nr:hypothetical protein K438DRAFT_1788448 [Mycena galopus ATCC 62051]